MSNHSPSFAKLVAPPSATAWAQTYHAGSVYAVVSVEETNQEQDPEHALPSVLVTGKDIINNLEAEYFAIAEKNLHSIKEAIQNVCKDIPATITATVLFAVLHQETLYLFAYGNGYVSIKRGTQFGTLLHADKNTTDVLAASGKIEPDDRIILATSEFTKAITPQELLEQLTKPLPELGEQLSPKLDDEKYAGAAAFIFSLQGASGSGTNSSVVASQPIIPPSQKIVETPQKEAKIDLDTEPPIEEAHETASEEKPKRHIPIPHLKLSRRQVFFLCLSAILVAILVGSILLNKNKQQNTQDVSVFNSEFPSAQQEYNEGTSLLSLNKGLAVDDFSKAQTTLKDLQSKLPKNSPQSSQVQTLLNTITQQLSGAANAAQSTLTPQDQSASKLLAAEITNPTNSYFAVNDTGTVYTIDTQGITNTNNTKQELVSNQKDWTNLGGFGTYLGNFYVLDTTSSQVVKFTKTAGSYTRANYFPSTTPSLSKAVSLTIDGDIWILSSDGTIQQFTKGKQDQFALQGLQEPLTNPTRIFTTADQDNLYILDNGNSRVVVIKKTDGTISGEYDATDLKNAKDIDVDEKNKKIFVLVSGKIFEIDMK